MKIVVITGANGGIGKALSLKFALEKYHVFMVCRDLQKGIQAQSDVIRQTNNEWVDVITADLASLSSIFVLTKKLKEQLTKKNLKIDLLINNAGILTNTQELTTDGFPYMMGVNFIGTAILTLGMLPLLSAKAKILNVNSLTYRLGNIRRDFFLPQNKQYFFLKKMRDYADSKLANLLFVHALAKELQEKKQSIVIHAIDPGVVNTNMITMHAWFDVFADKFFRPFIRLPQQVAEEIFFMNNSILSSQEKANGFILKGKKISPLPQKIVHYKGKQQLLFGLRKLMEKYE